VRDRYPPGPAACSMDQLPNPQGWMKWGDLNIFVSQRTCDGGGARE
jgi:hypothetical protein